VGGRSAEATRLAMRAGYVDVANVAGGVIAYLREIDSSQPEY
jgi:adenylyltransferase/sulfurtransferase